MKFLWVLVIVVFAVAGAGLAVQQGLIALPGSLALSTPSETPAVAESLSSIDQSLAVQIRNFREQGWQPPEILGSVSESVQQAGQATVSATVTTTPEEVWQSFREQGAQAALGQVVNTAEVSVNSVSQNVLNEARYQYCLGVVEARQSQ
jgi:hypothetical protein